MKKLFYILPLVLVPVLFSGKKTKCTIDKYTPARIAKLHPSIRRQVTKFVQACCKYGYVVRISSGLRTFAEQQTLYMKGRVYPGDIVTNAKPGYSYHNYGLAFDIVTKPNGKDWTYSPPAKVVSLAKRYGFSWGGDWTGFKDKPHFQYSKIKVEKLLQLYKNGKKDADGYVSLNGFSGLGSVKKEDPFKKAYDWAKLNLIGKFIKHPELPGKIIVFTSKGIRHSIYSRKNKLDANFIYSLPNSFLKASFDKKEKNKNNHSQNIWKFKNTWTHDNKTYSVFFVLKKYKENIFYYDHTVFKIKKP